MAIDSAYKKRIFSGFLWKFIQSVSSQGVTIVVGIILARLLLPEDYSVVAIVGVIFSFAGAIISGGFNAALIQKKETDEKDFSTVLGFNFWSSLFAYCCLFFFAPYVADYYHNEQITMVMRVMGLSFFINGYQSILEINFTRSLRFKELFFRSLVGVIISAIVGIYLAFAGYGPWALVAQNLSSSLVGVIYLQYVLNYKPSIHIYGARLKSLFSYGGKIYVASMITTLYDQTIPLFIGTRFSPKDLAFYTKGAAYPGFIAGTLSSTFSSVLFPSMAKFQDDKEVLLAYSRRFMQISSFLIFPALLGFLAISDNFVRVLLTEKWMPISIYIKIFCFSAMFNILQTGNLQVIRAIGRSDLILRLEIIKKVSYFIVIGLFLFISDRPEFLALTSICTTIIATCVNSYPNQFLIGYSWKMLVADIFPNLLMAGIMCVAVWSVELVNFGSNLLAMLTQILVGIVAYVSLCWICKSRDFYYVLDIIHRIRKKR